MGFASLYPSYGASLRPQLAARMSAAISVYELNMTSRSRDAWRPRFASSFALFEIEGAGKTGCLLHPRSRVRFALTKVHTSIQGSGTLRPSLRKGESWHKN